MNKLPIILDCDPGHDDAIAILLALSSDRLDVRAITTVDGNQTLEKTTINALKVLEVCGRTDVPVASGRSRALIKKQTAVGLVHGASGMDGPVLPDPVTKTVPMQAVELMAKVIEESEEPVTIVAVGPFTNVAVFLLSYPHLKPKVRQISVMGGGVLFGNRSVLGEFNIWKDPEAAKVVTESGIPLLLHGLDVTHRAIIRKEDVPLFRERPDKVSQFVADLLDFFIGGYLKSYKMAEGPLHDPCAIAALIDPAMFTTYDAYITVEVEGEHSRGATMTDLRPEGLRTHEVNGKVAMNIDREKYLQMLVSACEALAKRLEGGAK